MALTTTVDAPWSRVISFELSGCPYFQTEAEDTQALKTALWNVTYVWTYDELSDRFRIIDDIADGSAQFEREVNQSIAVIDEHLEDGDFDPADPAISDLYDSRFDLAESLLSDADSRSDDFVEIHMYADMIECSEESVALIDTGTGLVRIIHQYASC